MALEVATGTAFPSSTGSKSVTGLGFEPKLVIFHAVTHNSPGSNSLQSNFAGGWGAATSSSNQFAMGFWNLGFDGSVVTSNAACLHVPHPNASSIISRAAFTSMDSDGFTYNMQNVSGSWNCRIQWMAFGGADLSAVSIIGMTAKTSTGTQAYTGAGFEPNSILTFMNRPQGTANPQNRNDYPGISIGAASATQEAAISMHNDDNDNPSSAYSKLISTACVTFVEPDGTLVKEASLDSFDSDGFTLNYTTADSVPYRGYAICMSGPSLSIGAVSTKTSTGSQAYTGVGFQPRGLGLMSTGRASSTSAQADAIMGFGFTDGTNESSTWHKIADNTATPNPRNLFETDSIVDHFDNSDTLVYSASTTSLDSDGFTLNYGTADATARELIYLAFGDAGAGGTIYTRSVSQSLTLTQSVSQNLKSGEAENTLTLTSEATAALEVSSASSAIALTSTAVASNLALQSASNTLTFTQEAVATGPITAEAINTLTLTQVLDLAEEIITGASNTLALTQEAVNSGSLRKSAENTIEFIDTVDTNVKLRLLEQEIGVDHAVTVVKSKHAKSTLTITQNVDRSIRTTATSQLLALQQNASVVDSFLSRLNLTQVAEVYRPPGVEFGQNTLTLSQTVVVQKVLNLSASSSIGISHAIAHYRIREYDYDAGAQFCKTLETTYTPFVGGGTIAGLPTPPSTTLAAADIGSHTTGVNLWYPYTDGSTSQVALNRSANFGDIQRFGFDRINRETRGGTLIVYADPQWPKVESLLFQISAVCADKIQPLLTFLKTYIGVEIGLVTHEGRKWKGVIVNPNEVVIQDSRDSYTINLEFVGEEV